MNAYNMLLPRENPPTGLTYTSGQMLALRVVALIGASLSLIACFLMLYWYLYLKHRTFRHQLIMLLVLSDFCKALVELVYPAVTLANHDISAGSFCTLSGFFMSFFISATDFAVLIISIHAALCIFCPGLGRNKAEQGLYKWRYWVYTMWLIYPTALASLAFLNPVQAYTSAVSWCYLPVRPFYWRIALSWAPRYAIMLFILGLYVSIYVYAKRKFAGFSNLFKDLDSDLTADDASSRVSRPSVRARLAQWRSSGTASPELKLHGHLPEPAADGGEEDVVISAGPGQPTIVSTGRKGSVVSITLPTEEPRRASILSISAHNRWQQRQQRLVNDDEKVESAVIEKETSSTTSSPIDSSSSARLSLTQTDLGSISTSDSHRREVSRQLNLVLVYPLAFLIQWVPIFANHVLTAYSNRFLRHPVFPLALASACLLPLQGLIDCLVYARAEKPWRSLKKRNRQEEEHFGATESGRASLDFTRDIGDVEQRRLAEIREAQQRREARQSHLPLDSADTLQKSGTIEESTIEEEADAAGFSFFDMLAQGQRK
ncbi:hypothetical protein PYCC9005_003742 [Savitreella phatthalungensis]